MPGYGRRIRRIALDWVAGVTSPLPAAPTALYCGLSTADPGDAAAGIAEPTIGTGAYARATIGITQTNWTPAPNPTAGSPAVSANANTVSFPASSAPWSTGPTTLTHFFISDSTTAVTEAAFVARGALSPTTTVNAIGITLSFAAGTLIINMDDT